MKETDMSIFANSVYRINLGMDAVLELTPDQHAKILTAHDAFHNDEQVKATRAESQPSKNPDSAEASAYYSALKEARKKYDEALSEILKDEQKDLVKSLDRIGWEVEKEASGEGNKAERMAKVKELGASRLSEVLTPAQIHLLNAE